MTPSIAVSNLVPTILVSGTLVQTSYLLFWDAPGLFWDAPGLFWDESSSTASSGGLPTIGVVPARTSIAVTDTEGPAVIRVKPTKLTIEVST